MKIYVPFDNLCCWHLKLCLGTNNFKNPAKVNLDENASIEHVLPQNYSEEWGIDDEKVHIGQIIGNPVRIGNPLATQRGNR